jgi:hypothetical protein
MLIDILSTEFAREYHSDNQYLISCAFANYVYDHFGMNSETGEKTQMDGIIYPSVQWTECGMNLALLPDLVKNKVLLLDQVICQRMELTGDNEYTQTETLISKSIDYYSWTIKWS